MIMPNFGCYKTGINEVLGGDKMSAQAGAVLTSLPKNFATSESVNS